MFQYVLLPDSSSGLCLIVKTSAEAQFDSGLPLPLHCLTALYDHQDYYYLMTITSTHHYNNTLRFAHIILSPQIQTNQHFCPYPIG